jgi:hypothetical protein
MQRYRWYLTVSHGRDWLWHQFLHDVHSSDGNAHADLPWWIPDYGSGYWEVTGYIYVYSESDKAN